MLYLTEKTDILLAVQPTDFRRQIDGLAGVCRNTLKQDPGSGILFVFINRAKTMIRVLSYQDNGYWLTTKRLSKGRYQYWPTEDASLCSLKAAQLRKILNSALANFKKTG